MTFPRTTFLAVCAACALLSACATTGGAPPSTHTVAPYRDNIELSGRLAVSYQRDGKPQALSGKFTWRQSAAATDVTLVSPLGQTIAAIAVTPTSATLTQSGQAPRTAADIDTLSAQALGWSLPVSGLRDWLQGYALHDSVTTRDGWRLRFVSWQEPGDGPGAGAALPRPKRIDAERSAGPQSEPVAIRIVIDPVQP